MYENYRKLRDERGVTDYAVSKACGFKQTVLTEWAKTLEGSGSAPKVDKLQKIAEFFGVSIDYLVTGTDQAISERQKLYDKYGALLDEVDGLKESDQKFVEEIIKKIKAGYRDA